jgi:hypothetical protein
VRERKVTFREPVPNRIGEELSVSTNPLWARRLRIALVVFVAMLAGVLGCASPTQTRPIDGIPCTAEMLQVHFHAHLALLNDGRPVSLPAGIGIRRDRDCLYFLHTHKPDGIIHIEAPSRRIFTLGQFFDIWGKPLSAQQADGLTSRRGQTLHVFVNGRRYTGDPRRIRLAPHQLLTIEAGREVPPPAYRFPAGL